MFNEAFLFFWLVGIVEGLQVLFLIGGFVVICCAIPVCLYHDDHDDDDCKAKGPFRTKMTAVAGIIMVFIGALMPPPEAFYAGGVQYVGEAVELDDTVMRLKTILDAKIEDLDSE